MTTIRRATLDPTISAIVLSRRPLHYAEGSDDAVDRPAHVRAASSLAWIDGQIALAQDDANFVALVDAARGDARAIALPRGEGGKRQFDDARGNKKYKLDLEACVSVADDDGMALLAFGSGSKKRRRQIVSIDRWQHTAPRVTLDDATTFYERLEQETAFAGSDMNIEGVLVVAETLRFFGRGNGASKRGLDPLNATCDVSLLALRAYLRNRTESEPPTPFNVVQYQLGALDGVALGFTDAAGVGVHTLYSATAEASADATVDGPVAGSVVGTISPAGQVRYAAIRDPSGQLLREKVEGIVLSPTARDRAYVVIDPDDATRPSELCEIELAGKWWD